MTVARRRSSTCRADRSARPAIDDTELDRLEEVIAHVMPGDVALRSLAEDLGRPRAELERMTYRAAGRRAIRGR